MSLDVKITGGTVVDGTGRPGSRAEVGIRDGRIVSVGDCPEDAAVTIEAEGAIVTPGFVDLHCHYDGQVSWDAELMPSSIHGVTTCVIGNCGVGFAPVRPADREALVELMEGVEDIPGTALSEGIQWGWETFPQFMDAIDQKAHTIDVAAQVPHDALRVWVMGERGLAGEPATADDVEKMRAELRSALQAGAVGFSTGRTDVHRSASGHATPAAEADAAELEGLARAFEGLDHGVLQAVSDFDIETDAARFDQELGVLERMVEASGGHRFSLSLSERDLDPEQWRRILARAEAAEAAGRSFRVQVAPRGIGVLLGLQLTFHPFMGFPTYKKIAHLPLSERVGQLRRPEVRQALLAEQSEPMAGDGSPIPPLADKLLAQLPQLAFRMFSLGRVPNYEPTLEESLGMAAKRAGVSPLAALLDALLEDDGCGLIYFPIYNYVGGNLDHVGEMLHHPLALPGLSDGGAHVGTICDASFPTYLLSYWARDREKGRLPVERAVQMLSADGAAHLGLSDRGVLRPGARADVNVIDLSRLALRRPRLVHDLPAGGQRLLQDAEGYRATLVAGRVVARDGRLTGDTPGRLARPS